MARLTFLGHAAFRVEGGGALPADPTAQVTGRALDVEPDGRLIVVDDCGITHRFAVGDIIHLR